MNQRLLTAGLFTFVFAIVFSTLHLDANEFANDFSGGLGVLRFGEGTELSIPVTDAPSTEITLSVAYNGDSPVKVLSSQLSQPFAFKGGQFPGIGGNCSELINHDCKLVVSVMNEKLSAARGQLKLSYLSGQYRLTSYITLSGLNAESK